MTTATANQPSSQAAKQARVRIRRKPSWRPDPMLCQSHESNEGSCTGEFCTACRCFTPVAITRGSADAETGDWDAPPVEEGNSQAAKQPSRAEEEEANSQVAKQPSRATSPQTAEARAVATVTPDAPPARPVFLEEAKQPTAKQPSRAGEQSNSDAAPPSASNARPGALTSSPERQAPAFIDPAAMAVEYDADGAWHFLELLSRIDSEQADYIRQHYSPAEREIAAGSRSLHHAQG